MSKPELIWDKKFYPFLQSTVKENEYRNIVKMEEYLHGLNSDISIREIKELFNFLGKKGCEKSYFSFFLRTCDLSVAELINRDYYNERERIAAAKSAIKNYREKRRGVKTDKNSLQAYNDSQTAKRRSDAGEKKVIELSGLKIASTVADLDSKIAKINKSSGQFSMSKIKKEFGIKFKFSKKDKVPDCIFKIEDDVFIVEAKHVKGEGDRQNSSLSELISMLELKENKPNIHYIAFLDGSYTKYLAVSEPKKDGNKLEKQKYRIIETLQKNKNNYFLNTAGFERFVDDLR